MVVWGEVSHPDYPGERLVVCRNPHVAAERAGKREALLAATEAELAKVAAATAREQRPLRGKDKIGLRVGKVVGRYKVAKHLVVEIGEESFSYRRDEERIAAEAALDGIYVLRTNVSAATLSPAEVVSAYKHLANVERAFRAYNGDLDIRPIRHRKAERVRAHLFLCMLAHYVEWHMLERLTPMLFADDDRAGAEAARQTLVHPAARSQSAQAKARTKRNPGDPVHSFASLLADLATIAVNQVQPTDPDVPAFDVVTTPTPLQRRAFELLGVSPRLGFA